MAKILPANLCPACNEPLLLEAHSGWCWVFCGNGECPQPKLNDGAKGRNIESAYQALEEIYESLA